MEPALIDSGSSISTVTPIEAQKLMQSTEWTITKGEKKFSVENGGQKEEMFSGDYLSLPVQVINTNQWKTIRFYIMPHNHCLFQMILGLRDMKKIGYDICTRIADDAVLFKHSVSRKKMNYVENKEQILDKCKEMDDEFACYQLLQRSNDHLMHQSKDKEHEDSDESKEDGRTSSCRL